MSEEASLLSASTSTPLLQLQIDQNQNQPRIKNLRAKTTFLVRVAIVLIVGFIVLYSIYSKNAKPKPPHNTYLSALSKYYCHLTPHTILCRDSMPSIIPNFTELEPNPARLFTASLQLVADELNHTAISISKALSSSNSTSLIGPRMSACGKLVNDSLSRLNRSLSLLGVGEDMFFGSWISYVEGLNIRDEMKAARNNMRKCSVGLGVEEVESGVMKASRLAANFLSLFERRQSVLDDFYNPYYFETEGDNYLFDRYDYFDNYYYYSFDYVPLVCMFGVMYLFIGLLYFEFWQQ